MANCKGIIGKISVKSDHEVEWTIENFFSYSTKDKFYQSPCFNISNEEWQLRVDPSGSTLHNCVGWISLYLGKSDVETPPVGVCYTFSLKKVDGTVEQLQYKVSWVFRKGYGFYGYYRLIERSMLLRRKSELAPSDCVTFTCTLRTEKFFESPASLDALSRNLADLLISKKGCDSTLVVKQKEFSVHKLILSARSPVLAAMFEADMKEKRTGLVQIEDCDPGVFGEFLTYLYSGKVEKGSKNFIELYKIADKYDVRDLKSYCLISVMSKLSVENVLDAVLMGRQFGENSMNLTTQDFFNENYTKIIPTTKWAKFLRLNVDIANELLNGMVEEKVTKM